MNEKIKETKARLVLLKNIG